MDNEMVIPVTHGRKLRHPISGELPDSGGSWLSDQFTFRLIGDGTIKRMIPGSSPPAAIAIPMAAIVDTVQKTAPVAPVTSVAAPPILSTKIAP